MIDSERDSVATRVLALLRDGGAAAYFGEPVTQLDHALQTAALAEGANASAALVVAALLHDIGHLVPDEQHDLAPSGEDQRHEDVGERWLAALFAPAVTEPIRLHVSAKRYLCAIEPAYAASLSAASRESLVLQGGAMTQGEVLAFQDQPWALEAAALRRWDDLAKTPGLDVPGLYHYRDRLERLLEPQ